MSGSEGSRKAKKALPKEWLDEEDIYYEGLWTQQENNLYLEFVKEHGRELDKSTSRSVRAFQQMAKCIPTRTATQCRSHHQKMVKSGKVMINHRKGSLRIERKRKIRINEPKPEPKNEQSSKSQIFYGPLVQCEVDPIDAFLMLDKIQPPTWEQEYAGTFYL